MKQYESAPLQDITNIVGLPISERTVRHRRSEAGLGSYVAAEKPGLRPENVTARLEWAIRYKDWTIEDWKRFIWSDESSVWIGVNPRSQWVIRPPGSPLALTNYSTAPSVHRPIRTRIKRPDTHP